MNKSELSYQITAEICRGLSLMLHAGIGVADGLFLLAAEQGEFGELLTDMGKKLDRGLLLSEAMRESGVFAAYVVGMCHVGEVNGLLEEALTAVAAHYDEQSSIRRKIKSALTYPVLVLSVMLIVVVVLLTKVLPIFDNVYASMGSGLTGFSEKLLHLGELIDRALPILLIILLLAALTMLVLALSVQLRSRILRLFKKHLGDRAVFKKFNNARFISAMAMGISSGQSFEASMELAETLLADIHGAHSRVAACRELMHKGKTASQAMLESGLLSPSEARMMEVSQRAGKLERFMEESAKRKMDEAYEALDSLVSAVEPSMVLITAVLVGLILLSVMLPLMNIMSGLG